MNTAMKYEYDDFQNYLVYTLKDDDVLNEFWLKMTAQSKLKILPAALDLKLNEKKIKFPLSNLISLEKHISGKKFEMIDILDIIEQIALIMKKSIVYLFNPRQLVFNTSYIYFDYRTKTVRMVYLPVDSVGRKIELSEVIKSILNLSIIKSRSSMVQKLFEYTSQKNFCVEGLINLINQFKSEIFELESVEKNDNDIYEEGHVNDYEKADMEVANNPIVNKRNRIIDKSLDNFEKDKRNQGVEKIKNIGNVYSLDNLSSYSSSDKKGVFNQNNNFDFQTKKKRKNNEKIRIDKKNLFYFLGVNVILLIISLAIYFYLPQITGDLKDSKYALVLLHISVIVYIYLKFFSKKIYIKEDFRNEYPEEIVDNEVENNLDLKRKASVQSQNRIELPGANSKMKIRSISKASLNKRGTIKEKSFEDEYNDFLENVHDYSKEKDFFRNLKKNDISSNYKVPSADNESFNNTQMLSEVSRGHKIISDDTGEVVYVEKNNFKIGRQNDINDFQIERRTVGRYHAEILIKDSSAYVVDLGSKNGTFLNNLRLNPYEEYKLKDNDLFSLADVRFLYKNYLIK